ncbi:MAG: glycoside hydrolase family 13 protein [Motilibacteraceae bacterium]
MSVFGDNLLDQPHHDGSALHLPQQAPGLDEDVPVLVRVPRSRPVRAVHVRSVQDGEPRYHEAVVDHVDEHDIWYRATLPVHHPVTSYRVLLDHGTGYRWLNGTGVHRRDVPDAADFRATTFDPPPAWARSSFVYQVFPDRFARADGRYDEHPADVPDWAVPARWSDEVVHQGPDTPRQLFGGDLGGIEAHLDHLVDLGVDLLYMTPIFPSRSNHRYDASSFDRIDPLLGGDAALASLTDAAHRRGIRVMGDLTTNHTGDGHEWFEAAQGHPEHPEASYYYFRDHPDDYVSWWDFPSLPKLNWASEGLRQRFVCGPDSAVRRWLRAPYSLDGWRIDVANMTGRHGTDDYAHEVARLVRSAVRIENDDAFLLGEHFHDAHADLQGDGWHAVMNYAAFTRPVWTWLTNPGNGLPFLGMPVGVPRLGAADAFGAAREFSAIVPWRSALHAVNALGSHDTPRIRTVLGSDDAVEVAAGLLFTSVGVPMVFMGDELGLEGTDGEHSRTPMPWGDRSRFEGRTLRAYRDLARLRREHPALQEGGLRWAHVDDDAVVFLRESPEERLLVLAARAPHAGVRLPRTIVRTMPANLYGGASAKVTADAVELPGDGPTFQVWAL